MKTSWTNVFGVIALSTSLAVLPATAQDGPPPREGQQGQGEGRPPRGGPDDPGRPPQDGEVRPPGGGQGGPGGLGAPGGPGGGGMGGGPGGGGPGRMQDGSGARPMGSPEQRRTDVMRGYLELVERYAKLAADPDAAAISAVLTGADIVRPQGPAAIAEYLEGLLKETQRVPVKTAIRLQLIDAYKTSRDNAKAMAHIRALVLDTAGQGTPSASTPAKP